VIFINTFYGTLNIPEGKWGYYIFDTRTINIRNTNITDFLEEIYKNSSNSFIEISIQFESKINITCYKWETVFYAIGHLYKDKSIYDIYDWVILDDNDEKHYLGNFLFDNIGRFVQIKIRNYVRRKSND